MIVFGVIGSGAWGTKVIHAIRGLGFDVKVCNRHGEFEGKPVSTDAIEVIEASDIVWVATHPPTTCQMAMAAVLRGKPTVVEKPVAFTSKEVHELVSQSKNLQVPLIVDYIHLFNSSLIHMPTNGMLTMHIQMGGVKIREYSDLWDYGSHAVSIALHFNKSQIEKLIIDRSTTSTPEHEAGLFRVTLRFSEIGMDVTMLIGNRFTQHTVSVQSGSMSNRFEFKDSPYHQPLQTLISTIAHLHLCGEYWTNGDLAVEVTDLLERLHKMLPAQ